MFIVDNFAGAGGVSQGIYQALDKHPDFAINHDEQALKMHAANHPETEHLVNDVWGVDVPGICSGRTPDLVWFSPDCRHFSKAKGCVPVKKEIRDLAWIVIKWARIVRPKAIFLENVSEFQTWGKLLQKKNGDWYPDPNKKGETFKQWVAALRQLGYELEWRELCAADYGVPTIRKRLFLVARCDGQPIRWPEPTHAPRDKAFMPGLQPWTPAHSIIDWSIPAPSIFDRKRPLAENSCKRIAAGMMKYVINAADPFIYRMGHTGSDPLQKTKPLDEPLSTIVTKNSHCLVVPKVPQVAAFVARHYGGMTARSIDEPFPTITTRGTQNQLVTCKLSTLHDTTAHESHEQNAGGDRPWLGRGKVERRDLAPGGSTSREEKEARRAAETGVKAQERLPRCQDLDGRQPVHGDSASPSVDCYSRADPSGDGHQPQEWEEGRQSSGELRGSDPVREPSSRLRNRAKGCTAAETEPVRSLGGEETEIPGLFIFQDRAQVEHIPDECLQRATTVAAFLVKYYGSGGQLQSVKDPVHTIPTKGRFGLVTCTVDDETYVVTDIGMRMLEVHELAAAQGFPPDYKFIGTKTQQIAKIGNSVCPGLAEALVRANFPNHIHKDAAGSQDW